MHNSSSQLMMTSVIKGAIKLLSKISVSLALTEPISFAQEKSTILINVGKYRLFIAEYFEINHSVPEIGCCGSN